MEPKCEYWIRVTSHLPDDAANMFSLEVDNKKLDPGWVLEGGSSYDNGNWSQSGLVVTEKAFQVRALDRNSDVDIPFYVGNIKIHFFEAVYQGERERVPKEWKSHWQDPSSDDLPSCRDGEKALLSSIGTVTTTSSLTSGTRKMYDRGPWLQTIKLNYCTALGLIHEGVLPKPKLDWNYQRLRFPADKGTAAVDPRLANLQPEMVTFTTYVNSDVVTTLYREKFDLTHLEDDDEEKEEEDADDVLADGERCIDQPMPTAPALAAATAATVSDDS